jgi:hypothetical protein
MTTFLIIAGGILLTLGVLGWIAERRAGSIDHAKMPKLQLLPGDIKYESPSGNVRVYIPITTSIVLSIVLTLLLRFLS